MYGKTAGVIGTGKIGVAMLRILKGFGMRLLAFDPYPSAAALELGVEYVDLATLYKESDVISLHCPLTDENYHLLNREAFDAGFVGGGVARGLCVGVLVTAISLFFVPFQVHSWLFVALTLVLTAILFSLAGLLNAVFAKTFDDISLIPTFVLTPLTYLGGVFYSLTLLPPFWQGLSQLNPIVYMISGFRYGFLGIHDVPLVTTFGVLVVFIVVFYLLCWSLIQRGRGLRS